MTEEKINVESKKGLMTNTLKELDDLDIQALSIVSIGDLKLNLTNDQLIKLVNFNAGRKVLTWDTMFKDLIRLSAPFLA